MQPGNRVLIVAFVAAGLGLGVLADDADVASKQVTEASAAYAKAYNARDYQQLADHWTETAELIEGGSRVAGRDRIVASIRGWLERHDQATIAIDIDRVNLLAKDLARVEGVIRFTPAKGEKPIASRFSSLRVQDDGTWRLAESFVAPSHAAALRDLAWLVGQWRAADEASGLTVDLRFEQAAGGFALVGRTTARRASGDAVESIEMIHADRDDGRVRTTIIDSTGAHAEGVIEGDGTSINRILAGVPGDAVPGGRVQWVQAVVPGGEGRFTLQSIERSIDGRPVADGKPLHFEKK
jgi:uncharacterized protein (TIGR02246 family)